MRSPHPCPANAPTAPPVTGQPLGKPADDSTGLTHVGAREYDPSIGQFISIDPLLTLDQHQSLNGYVYANNTPVTTSDPSGLGVCMQDGPCGSVDAVQEYEKKRKEKYPELYDAGGTASTDSSGQTMWNSDGQVLSCAYGHCIGNVDVHLNLGNNRDTFHGPQPEFGLREFIRWAIEGPVCNPGYPCENMLIGVAPIGPGSGGRPGQKGPSGPEAPLSKGRVQQLSGDAYEVALMNRFGGKPGSDGKPGFKVGKRKFDGRYTPEGSSREVWYEAKSGKYWERLNEDADEMLRFKSKLGESRRIAVENGADFRVVSENPIPQNMQNYFQKKGFEWEVVPRG
ncbi:RHS repeat domain-containing protein [Streptomyces sp. R28]|uniref:RHS repeat domain-containing protein n=1 Tax=Streptomyces sp. R28 TaxID=3238628 RepID=A0AB39QAI3_9ACTN